MMAEGAQEMSGWPLGAPRSMYHFHSEFHQLVTVLLPLCPAMQGVCASFLCAYARVASRSQLQVYSFMTPYLIFETALKLEFTG